MVIRAVRPPEDVVLVVKIPAEGLRLTVGRGGPMLLLDLEDTDGRAARRGGAVVASGGVKVSDGIFPSRTVAEEHSGEIRALEAL